MPFAGFPRRVRQVPVPAPLLGHLLEEIDDLAELKLTLRVIWLLHQKRGYPRFVTLDELLADGSLVRAVARGAPDPRAAVEEALARALRRGTLWAAKADDGASQRRLITLNTEADRKALARVTRGRTPAEGEGPSPLEASPSERPNIFALYEDNIGMLSPIIAEELREAEQLYPPEWIEDAFREAVRQNKRSWRYIARILERWEREGRRDGEPGRHTEKTRYY